MDNLIPVIYYWKDNYAVIDDDNYVLFLTEKQLGELEGNGDASACDWYNDVKKINTITIVNKYDG